MIKEAMNKFIEAFEGKSTLRPLYQQKTLIVEVMCRDEVMWLKIRSDGHIVVHVQPPEEEVSLVISGSDEGIIEQVLLGERPLLTLKEEGGLQVSGSFSHQLTLESLFILSGERSYLVV